MLAMWTKGPSFPNGIPLPSVNVRPTILATRVLKVKYLSSCIRKGMRKKGPTGHILFEDDTTLNRFDFWDSGANGLRSYEVHKASCKQNQHHGR